MFRCGSLPRTVGEFIRIPIIRPEDVALYLSRKLADKIKIYSRSYGSERLRRTCRAYAVGAYGGDMQDLVSLNPELNGVKFSSGLIPEGFAARVLRCAGNCPACGYCDRVAGRVISFAD